MPRSRWFIWLVVGVVLGFSISMKIKRGVPGYTVTDRGRYVLITGPHEFKSKVYK